MESSLDSLRAQAVPRAFFLRDARVVARALIGTYLVHAAATGSRQAARAVRIVETEAY